MEETFDQVVFDEKIANALAKIGQILDNTREPQLPENIHHSYLDKYTLSEFLSNMTLSALIEMLKYLEVNEKVLLKFQEEAQNNKSITLRFKGEERCTFIKKESRKEEHPTSVETTINSRTTISSKVVTTITEYFYTFTNYYELLVFSGTNSDDGTILLTKNGEYTIITRSEDYPKPKVSIIENIDVNITKLIQKLDSNFQFNVIINRSSKICHTPRRNETINEIISLMISFYNWSKKVLEYLRNRLFPVQQNHGLDLSLLSDNNKTVFTPNLPFMDENGKNNNDNKNDDAPTTSSTVILSDSDMVKFLQEQNSTINQKLQNSLKVYPDGSNLISQKEAKICIILNQIQNISMYFIESMNYIESLLKKQLIAAIGKEIGPKDLVEYMDFHYHKLFKKEYALNKFCYSIRRVDHYPEGILSIERENNECIPVITKLLDENVYKNQKIQFSINEATTIQTSGLKYIHGWVDHCFSSNATKSLQLHARARQFSCFILVIGNLISSDTFNPKEAIIIKNKDDLLIPLLLEQLPTAKAFRDAIESLSPEQQRFAKAFRSMQLESSIIAFSVIQIKPQLEKLLNLSDDSLTKEIELTEDLLDLFITYQIPCDLLSYDGDERAAYTLKINRVRSLVQTMKQMIERSKQNSIDEKKKQDLINQPQQGYGQTPVSYPYAIQQPQYIQSNYGYYQPQMQQQSAFPSYQSGASYSYGAAPPTASFGAANSASAYSSSPFGSTAYGSSMSMNNNNNSNVFSSFQQSVVQQPTQTKTSSIVAPVKQEVIENDSTAPIESNSKDSEDTEYSNSVIDSNEDNFYNFTKLPTELDKNFEKFDVDSALHTTITRTGPTWEMKSQKDLLAEPVEMTLTSKDRKREKEKAFDLLDAITKSGALPIVDSSFHVFLAATHSFDKTLINTVIQDNINPIEKIERSMLIIASTLHELPASELIKPENVARVQEYSPNLF